MKKVKENVKMQKETLGITLIALVVTIIVLLILAGVTIATLTGDNGILGQAQKATIATEVAGIKEKIELNGINDGEEPKITGRLSEIDMDIPENLVNKYNDILYIKDSKLYLDFIAGFPNIEQYKNNKEIIETLSNNLEICYESMKDYNKIQNPYFDDGLTNYVSRSFGDNKNSIMNENGNNYLNIQMYERSGNTNWVQQFQTVTENYGEKIYMNVSYRNRNVEKEDNYKINNNIIEVFRLFGGGYGQCLLNKNTFLDSYNKGWKKASGLRTIQSETGSKGVAVKLGGPMNAGSTWEYSVDFDNIYVINLTEIFGEGNEPPKEKLDEVFKNF